MLNSIVGPAIKGVADFASPSRDKKGTGSDSFGKVFEEKASSITAKDREKIEPDKKVADPPRTGTEIKSSRESEHKKPEAEQTTVRDKDRPEKPVKGKSQREQAISKFMDSFESEFGVPPTRIVDAMANLKLDEQAKSPEETADVVIDQLDLDDKDKDPAKGMYIGLLAQLQQIEKTPPSMKPEMSLVAAGSQGRFEEIKEQRGALNQSLQSMNEKFFMSGSKSGLAGAAGVAGTGSADLSQEVGHGLESDFAGSAAGMDLQQQIQANPDFKIDPTKLTPDMQKALQAVKEANPTASPEVALAALVAAARTAKAKAAGGTSTDNGEDSELGAGVVTSGAETGSASRAKFGNNEPLQGQDVGAPEMVAGVAGQASGREKSFQSFQQGQQQDGLSAKTTKGEVAAKDKSVRSSEFDGTLRANGMPAPTPLKDLGLSAAPAANIANVGTAAGKSEEKADIRQIMNQAQYLIKKGGGEMKVEMTPEGMGKIHMKVLVENGKVNVQMSAETNEAKKAIEGGLSELKNSLAAHRLSMDHIKVDVVSATNTENTAQNQTNQNPSGREQNRQFWNHFSQDFGSPSQQRENFSDIPSLRGYARPRTDLPLEPISNPRAIGAASGKGRGLNLVA